MRQDVENSINSLYFVNSEILTKSAILCLDKIGATSRIIVTNIYTRFLNFFIF